MEEVVGTKGKMHEAGYMTGAYGKLGRCEIQKL